MAEQKSKGSFVGVVKAAFSDFGKDDCGTRAAALAYATVFALPALLIILVTIVGKIWSPAEVQRTLETQFAGMIGPDGARQVRDIIAHSQQSPGRGIVATITSIVGLILGATGAFLALQDALNQAWNVKPDPAQGGIRQFITKRLLSLGMVLGLGFLLAVSLALTAAISALGGALFSNMPQGVKYVIDLVLSLVILTALFAGLFKVLPDADVAWKDVWIGGAATAILFVLGKYVIGLYLGHSKPGNAFGAAGALAVILVWSYYAGMIVLLGAEFTQEWALQRGEGLEPADGAVRVMEQEVLQPAGTAGKHPDNLKPEPVRGGTRKPVGGQKSGGIGDWLLGLPVLYLLFKRGTKDLTHDAQQPKR
jgi:membrane protein